MKSLAVSVPDYAASVLSAPRLLRIAIPSWRTVGIHPDAEPNTDQPSLSREELQNLFHGELNGKASKKQSLTDGEEHERTIAQQLRSALYPGGGH